MTSCWFETIPLDEYDEEKRTLMTELRTTKWSSKMQFFRKIRDPDDIPDLWKHMKGTHLIWMNEGTFIMLKKLPKTVSHNLTLRKATISIDFSSSSKSVYIYGISNDIVAGITEQLLLLKDEGAEEIQIGNDYNRKTDSLLRTTFLTPQFVQNYVEANPQRRLSLGLGCLLSNQESIALASHPDPLNVGIGCSFDDQGKTFIYTLSQRRSDFGTLALHHRSFARVDMTARPFDFTFNFNSCVMRSVSHIALNMKSDLFYRFQIFDPSKSPARRVEYEVCTPNLFAITIDSEEPFTVVPPAFTLVFTKFLPPAFRTQFLENSANLREMGLIYDIAHPPNLTQQNEVLEAIAMNPNLRCLELGFLHFDTVWVELLEVIGSRVNLQTVVFWVRHQPDFWADSEPDLHQLETLVPFMKANPHLDISFKCRGKWKSLMDKVQAVVEPVRHQIRAKHVTHESPHDRPAIFGAALTMWASVHVSKTFALLQENTDLLCSLMDPSPSSPTVAPQRQRPRREDDLHLSVETRKRSARFISRCE